jgi:ribosomal protein S18 acetylase RimI-like enzyme
MFPLILMHQSAEPSIGMISLRPAGEGDEAFLFRVYASTRDDLLPLIGDAALHEALVQMQFTAQVRHYRQCFPGSGYEVVEAGGKPAGRLWTHRAPSHHRLVDIALLPEFRGRGIGSALIRALLEEAVQIGKPLRLHVEAVNRAVRLYRRLGFAQIGADGVYLEMEWNPPGTNP